jgi:hypothetical protein
MGYDLLVNLKGLHDLVIPAWLSEIRKLNMDAEVSPGFSFHNHSGFLPFKIVVKDCPNADLNGIELMTGFELFVRRIEGTGKKKNFLAKLFGKQQPVDAIEKKLSEADTEASFRISARDSFEFRMGWYSAAALALLCDGVLTDLQTGIQLEGNLLIRHAHEAVLEDERAIRKDEWKIHEFKEWLNQKSNR